ncbi:hypothetical protein [uncultured Ruegeria sp.]|uniref:hypothetical protein n=1 Tax=uncultured Ruegeria sp. TaxID=259304 RepID=UPI00260D4DD5|nr:hypothetical protein [uncultured Ruegeria sp.]
MARIKRILSDLFSILSRRIWWERMNTFLDRGRNRADLMHVAVPLTLAVVMAPTSFGGALLFLLVWGLVRVLGYG